MLTLETILNESLWVAKVGGCRFTGTYKEVESWKDDEDCRDFDLLANQPEHLKPFYDAYWKYDEEHGFVTVQDFYNNVYSKRRVWAEDEIRNLIQTNDKVLYRALKKLYECQTAEEQGRQATIEHNGIGFNGVDGGFLSSVSEFLIKKGYLTDKQKVVVRKKLVKYTRQLTRLANA